MMEGQRRSQNEEGPTDTCGPPSTAMVLAAGFGTRLGPLTDHTPKCMVPIGGQPLVEHTIGWLRRYGVTKIIINLCHLPDGVRKHFGDGANWDVEIAYSLESQPMGTAGGVKKVSHLFKGPFFVWYGDNLSTCRLDRLWEFHQSRHSAATIALFHREDPSQSGIVELGSQDRITRFLEKPGPHEIFSRWVSAGIFVLEPEVLRAIPGDKPADFGRDVFPALLAADRPLYGYRMSGDERLWWIDTPADLERVQIEWNRRRPS